MSEPSIETLYEQVRAAVSTSDLDAPPALSKVAPGIRVLALRTPTLPPATRTNSYLVGPEQGPQILVDPGSPYPDAADALDAALARDAAAGRPLAMIALTHHHGDHVGGAARVASRWNVPVAAHVETARRLAGRVPITRELADGDTLDAGGIAVTCVFTPGHAPGHLCFETAHAIAVGDMVAGIGWILVDPSEGDMTTYLASLDALLARPPLPLLPAHGPVIADGRAKLREYIAHRLAREAKVIAALARRDGDAPIDELVPEVYADTPRPLWSIASRVLVAHLDKLARDGKARETAAGRWAATR